MKRQYAVRIGINQKKIQKIVFFQKIGLTIKEKNYT